MATRRANRVAGACAIAGSVLLFIGTYLHPMSADPNDPLAAFAEYAADHLWVASHLTQLAGVALMMVALLFLAQELEGGRSASWARIGAAGAIAGLAIAAALQAVDGVALKVMVNAWAAAPPAQKEGAFQAAFAVRQIEAGLAAMVSMSLGITATIYGVALALEHRRWLGILGIVGGVPTAIAGVVIAYTGFSEAAMDINMPANSLLLIWMIVVGIYLWRPGSAAA